MITRVKLKNWRSHQESDFEFSKGTNGLIGIIGSGKSSVMNAISFGLFGTFPDLQSRRIKLNDIIMSKPSVEDESQVTVDFTVDGKNYSVMRIIERDKGTTYSEIREQGNLLDAPNTQRVTEIIQGILKIDYDLFSRAIYSEQNGLDYFLTLPRGERMRRIDNLLMIDRFERARSGVVTLQNKLIERKIGKQSIIEQTDIKEIEKSLKDIEYSLKKLQETKSNLSTELKEKEKKKKNLEDEIKKIESIEKELISIKNEKKSIEGAIKENEDTIKTTEKLLEGEKPDAVKNNLKKLETRIQEMQGKLKKDRARYEELTQTISQRKTRIKFLGNDIKKLEQDVKEKSELKEKLTDIRKEFGKNPSSVLKKEREELEKSKESITSLSTKLGETEETLRKVIELKEICPVCESKINKKRREQLIEQYKKRTETIKKQLEYLVKDNKTKKKKVLKLEGIVNKFENYIEKTKDFEELQIQLKDSKKNHFDLSQVIDQNKGEFNKLKNNLSVIEKGIEEKKIQKEKLGLIIEKLSRLKDKKSRLSDLNSEKEDIEKQYEKISKKIGEKNLGEIRSIFRDVISRYSELTTRIKGLDEIIIEKENRKKEHNDKLNLIEKQKKEILTLEKIIRDLKIFGKALERTQSQLRERFVDTVNYTMDEIWSNLYPYGDFLSARLYIEDRDYVLQLKARGGDWINVEGTASGGERSIASLALRIAFSIVLAPQLKWLILDEPTHNLDTKAVEDLAETLRTRIGDFADQVFLITHEKNLENAVTGSLYKLYRKKEMDGITKIERVN